jgi:hypothetical protein
VYADPPNLGQTLRSQFADQSTLMPVVIDRSTNGDKRGRS